MACWTPCRISAVACSAASAEVRGWSRSRQGHTQANEDRLLLDPDLGLADAHGPVGDAHVAGERQLRAATDAEAQVLTVVAALAIGVAEPHATIDVKNGSVITTTRDLDVTTVIRTRDVKSWRVQALELEEVTLLQDGDKIEVHTARLTDFAFGQPAPTSAELSYTADFAAADASALPLSVEGFVTVQPDPQRIQLTDTSFTTDGAAGTCNATLVPIAVLSARRPVRTWV